MIAINMGHIIWRMLVLLWKMGRDQDHGIINLALNMGIGKLILIGIHYDHLN